MRKFLLFKIAEFPVKVVPLKRNNIFFKLYIPDLGIIIICTPNQYYLKFIIYFTSTKIHKQSNVTKLKKPNKETITLHFNKYQKALGHAGARTWS